MPGPLRQQDASVAGPLFMLSAALLFAMLDICIKLLGSHFSAWDIVFYQTTGGIVILQLIFGRRRNIFKGNNMKLLVARGVVGAIAFLSIVTAIRLLPVSTAMFIVFTYPAFAAVFSFILLKEGINRFEAFCLVMVLVGAGVFFDFRLTGNLVGQSIALLGGVLSGLAMTLIHKLRREDDSVIIYLYFCIGCALLTAPKFVMNPTVPTTVIECILILCIIFSSLVSQLLMNQGLLYCRGWEGGVFLSCEVIFTAIVGITFLADPVSWRFWLGGSLILGSVTLINRRRAAKKNVAATLSQDSAAM